MTDPVGDMANSVENAGKSAWSSVKGTVKGAFKIAAPIALTATVVAGLSFAMQPALAASVASSFATQEAATTLSGAIAKGAGSYINVVGTGLANSGPVWEATQSALSSAGSGISDWWGDTNFTPTNT